MSPFLKEYDGDESDIFLVNEAKTGDRSALEKLILKHQPYIYNIAWRMVRNPRDAEDLTQEVNIKIITKLSEFHGKSTFRTWLYRIVTNHFLMALRKPNEEFFTRFDAHAEGLANAEDQELTEIEKEENKEVIKELNYGCMSGMVLCLNREQRIVYILGAMLNADHTVGSEILEISKSNFRQRLNRARKDINNFMQDKCGLVNESNPCRCYKKVTYAIKGKAIDSKNLLFNRKEYANFQNEILKPRTDELFDLMDDKYTSLLKQLPFKKEFDKKTILEDIINDEKVKNIFNLN